MPTTTNKIPVACFAPELTDDKLASYSVLVSTTDPKTELGEWLRRCLACVKEWYALPTSTRTDTDKFQTIRNGKKVEFAVTPLEESHVKSLWDVTPWMSELNQLSNGEGTGLFDSLTGELRDCAFHLLWHAKEITLDREPLTQDKLA